MSRRGEVFLAFVKSLRTWPPSSLRVVLLAGGPPASAAYTAHAVGFEQTGRYSLEHWLFRVAWFARQLRAWGLVGIMPDQGLSLLARGLERVAVRAAVTGPLEGRVGGVSWATAMELCKGVDDGK